MVAEQPGPRPRRSVDASHSPVPGRRDCHWCRQPICRGREQYAVIANSSVIDPDDPNLDGRQLVIACSSEHLGALQAAAPPWHDEQLWAGQLARANDRHHRAPLPLPTVAPRAGLTLEQAKRAVAFRQSQEIAEWTTDV